MTRNSIPIGILLFAAAPAVAQNIEVIDGSVRLLGGVAEVRTDGSIAEARGTPGEASFSIRLYPDADDTKAGITRRISCAGGIHREEGVPPKSYDERILHIRSVKERLGHRIVSITDTTPRGSSIRSAFVESAVPSGLFQRTSAARYAWWSDGGASYSLSITCGSPGTVSIAASVARRIAVSVAGDRRR